MASVSFLEGQIRSIESAIRMVQQDLALATRSNNTTQIRELQAELSQLNSDLLQTRSELQEAQRQEALGTVSSGQVVNDDARATVSNSSAQRPTVTPLVLTSDGRIQTVPDTSSESNALRFRPTASQDFGIDANLRPLTQTQSTSLGNNEQGSGLLLDPAVDGREEFDGSPSISSSVGGRPGAGSPGDDSGGFRGLASNGTAFGTSSGSATLTRAEIDQIFYDQKIIAQPNVLDQYSSYTYQISVYLCNPLAFNRLIANKRKSLEGCQLLFQSGGASPVGRSSFFSNDYYIDRLEIKSKIIGKGTGMSHNAAEMSMTVIEPNGITLVDNIDKAVQSYLGGSEEKKKNFTSQIYLIVIRFYGYDEQGQLVKAGVSSPDGVTDRTAFIEKFYPACLADVQFRIANRAVEYQLKWLPPAFNINTGTDRGTIPYNIELSGQTLRELLAGPAVYAAGQTEVNAGSNVPGITVDDNGVPLLDADQGLGAPPKANAATSAKKTVRQGLMAALNEFQQQLVADGTYLIADEYSVEFANQSIASAEIVKAGQVKKSTPMSTSDNPSDQKLPQKQSTDTDSRTTSVTAGMQIVQFLDQVVRNSTFMEDQQVIKFNESSQLEEATGTPAKNVAWYKISMQTEIKGYDEKRNDYAYKVKYIIHAYKVINVASKYYPKSSFSGVQKRYNYWFTGENTSVLSYEENLNALYKLVLSGGVNFIDQSVSELVKYNFQPRSGESSQGAQGKANEPPANFAEQMYSPSDLKECTMTIVGDPAWLQQGEMFAGFPTNKWDFNPFLPDGTINIDSQQPLFQVSFNKPQDYDLNTGVINPNQQDQSTVNSTNSNSQGGAQVNRVYVGKECISLFDKGKFTQTLKGSLLIVDPNEVARANREQSQATALNAIQNLSFNRQWASIIPGALSTPAFLNNLPTIAGLGRTAQNFGINVGGLNFNGILGSSPTRPSATPTNPTSFGLSVGSTVLNSINVGTADTPSLGTPPFAGSINAGTSDTLRISARDLYIPTEVGPSQQMAAGDDSGALTSREQYAENQDTGNLNG